MNKSIFFVQKQFEKFVDILATVSFVATLFLFVMVKKASAMFYFSQKIQNLLSWILFCSFFRIFLNIMES